MSYMANKLSLSLSLSLYHHTHAALIYVFTQLMHGHVTSRWSCGFVACWGRGRLFTTRIMVANWRFVLFCNETTTLKCCSS